MKNCFWNENKKLIVVRSITVLTFITISFLIFAQVFLSGYTSDWPTHLSFIVKSNSSEYSLFHFVLKLVYYTFDSFTVMAAFSVFLGITSNLISYLLVRQYLLKKINKEKYKVELLCLSLFIVSMITIPFFPINSRYLGVGTPNPWHNPTFFLVRPFAISSFIFITQVNKLIENNKPYVKPLILFSASMLISALMKPSFYLVFLPALFFYYLYVLIRSKFKKIFDCFLLGLSVVPAGIVLIFQNMILFGSENSIKISWIGEVWNSFAPLGSVSLSILLGISFPLFVFISNAKKLKFENIIIILTLLFGIMEAYFLTEIGPRHSHGNFFWGYYLSMFLAYLVSSMTFINTKNKTRTNKIIGCSLFSLHLISGIIYYIQILFGVSYM